MYIHLSTVSINNNTILLINTYYLENYCENTFLVNNNN